MSIRCGNCKDRHDTVLQVRTCHSITPNGGFQAGVERSSSTTPPSSQGDLPEGYFAVTLPGETKLRFFRIKNGKAGSRWEGYQFVSEQASDEFYSVKDRVRRDKIKARIAINPREAMMTYGREIGSCGVCNRTLTDEKSRKIGIGPICRVEHPVL